MGCPACARKKKGDGYTHFEALQHPPFNANDVQIYSQGELRRLGPQDWPDGRHKLLLFVPGLETPMCSDFDLLGDWVKEFDKLDCDLYLASSDQAHIVKDMADAHPTIGPSGIKVLSSYLLPTRLGIMHNGRSMHASVFITKEADVVTQQHFLKVGRSLSELHRMLFAYTTSSHCAHDWIDPSKNFSSEKEKNDGAEKI
jgi:alkyl hydroperoxide reductase subunit AhpC